MEKNEKKPRRKPRFCVDTFRADSVVLRGERRAVIYGCRRILRYSKASVCLSLGKRRVRVFGEELICTAFSAGTVTVEGVVAGVLYCTHSCANACPLSGEGAE